MGMNPDTDKKEFFVAFKHVAVAIAVAVAGASLEKMPGQLLRPDGSSVPEHWSTFKIGEEIPIEGYIFGVAYIGESSILFEPVGPAGSVLVGTDGSSSVLPEQPGQIGQ